ncbi:MAG: hypothetical protein JSU68_02505 [Phycisphaerales bacterium]|nr:MAG: hypothetical protein JSU68_02505 [Phycisphaerales bacterium]
MLEAIALAPAITMIDLTVAYWACLVLGGGLLVISALSGAHTHADMDVAGAHVDFDADVGGAEMDFDVDAGGVDADFDADVSTDADLTGHADADVGHVSGLASWFSIRFLIFFVAVFGAVGVVLTHLTGLGRGFVFGLALVGGVAVGECVHKLFLYLRRTSGDSAPRPQDYVNKLARVTIVIRPGKKGQISLQVRDARRFVPALARRSDAQFTQGCEVFVVAYRGGIAEVVSCEDYEQLRNKH